MGDVSTPISEFANSINTVSCPDAIGTTTHFCRKEGAGRNAGKNPASPPATRGEARPSCQLRLSTFEKLPIFFLKCRSRWIYRGRRACGGCERQTQRRWVSTAGTVALTPPARKCQFLPATPMKSGHKSFLFVQPGCTFNWGAQIVL
jgi:hypothetical protein